MASKTLLLLAILLSVFTFARCDLAWCFRCSWQNSEVPGPNLTTCSDEPTDKQNQFLGSKKANPALPPYCKGKVEPSLVNQTGYDALNNACYPNACQVQGGGRCIRWEMHQNDDLLNVTLFCGMASDIGCFTQELPNGYRREVCVCENDWCNGGHGLKVNNVAIAILVACACVIARILNRE